MESKRKNDRYRRIYEQLKNDLLPKCNEPESRMSTIIALLHHKMEYFFWTGFYLLVDDRLLVRSYQGPVACMELKKNQGVCWAGINKREVIIVPDVEKFPGHIACSSLSRSEIVIPVFKPEGSILGVLDVDSKELNMFNEIDGEWLNKITGLIYQTVD